MSETRIMHAIHDAVVASGRALLWRNNSGMATYQRSRVRYGLGIGSADLIGVIRSSGRFFALEVKTPKGRLSPEQRAWHHVVRNAGGFVACVRSVSDAMQAIEEASA